jgi:N-acetylmuramoyl-L-alanine amidase
LGKIAFWAIRLRTIVILAVSLIALTLVMTSLYYVNMQTVYQVGLQQAFSNSLAGRTIAVDPGHGGYDPGAKGSGGNLEKDLNLSIALKLRTVLEQAGARVVMTRAQDVDLITPGEGTKKFRDLTNRLKIVEEHQTDVLISIHLNSSGSRWRGAQVFYHPKHEYNRELAVAIQEELRLQLKNTNRQALPIQSAFLLTEAEIPAVIVEAGFLTNPEEEKLLTAPDYQEKIARAIASGIANYLAAQ